MPLPDNALDFGGHVMLDGYHLVHERVLRVHQLPRDACDGPRRVHVVHLALHLVHVLREHMHSVLDSMLGRNQVVCHRLPHVFRGNQRRVPHML